MLSDYPAGFLCSEAFLGTTVAAQKYVVYSSCTKVGLWQDLLKYPEEGAETKVTVKQLVPGANKDYR